MIYSIPLCVGPSYYSRFNRSDSARSKELSNEDASDNGPLNADPVPSTTTKEMELLEISSLTSSLTSISQSPPSSVSPVSTPRKPGANLVTTADSLNLALELSPSVSSGVSISPLTSPLHSNPSGSPAARPLLYHSDVEDSTPLNNPFGSTRPLSSPQGTPDTVTQSKPSSAVKPLSQDSQLVADVDESSNPFRSTVGQSRPLAISQGTPSGGASSSLHSEPSSSTAVSERRHHVQQTPVTTGVYSNSPQSPSTDHARSLTGSTGGVTGPASPRQADDRDSSVKRNLLEMLSKSKERRRKPRALPSLNISPQTQSPTTSIASSRFSPVTGSGSPGPRPLSALSLSTTSANSATPPPATSSAMFKEPASIEAWMSSPPPSPTRVTEYFRPKTSIEPELLPTIITQDTTKLDSSSTVNSQDTAEPKLSSTVISQHATTPELPSYAPKNLLSVDVLKPEDPVSPVTSELLYHMKDEIQNLSSGETDSRNLLPLFSEMESREESKLVRSEVPVLVLPDSEATSRSEITPSSGSLESSQVISQASLPLGNLDTGSAESLEQVVATSLPDFDDQHKTER